MSMKTARMSVSTSAVVALLSALSLSGVAIAQADMPATAPATTPATAPAEAPKAPATDKMIYATMSTSMGDIVLELNREKAPLSVDNFVEYARSGHYDGTVFHRVIPGFMVQGGGFTSDMTQKPTRPPIKNEWKNGLKNSRGTLAMARTSVIDSATSQFFINVVDNAALDMPRDGAAYAVFGRVVSGMDVADKIVAVPTTRTGPHANVPATPITITGVKILTPDEAAKFATPATPATPAAPTPPSAPKAPAAPAAPAAPGKPAGQ
jgi:peptidyl-prolyl cis-trans isomerase A (cyclophilin A)